MKVNQVTNGELPIKFQWNANDIHGNKPAEYTCTLFIFAMSDKRFQYKMCTHNNPAMLTDVTGLLLFIPICTASVTLELVWHESAQDRGLVCNDGSPGGYYFREATDVAAENNWIFYLEGGGWCWNSTSCEKRITSNGEEKLV